MAGTCSSKGLVFAAFLLKQERAKESNKIVLAIHAAMTESLGLGNGGRTDDSYSSGGRGAQALTAEGGRGDQRWTVLFYMDTSLKTQSP